MWQISTDNSFEQILTVNRNKEVIVENLETFSKIIIEQTVITKNSPNIKRFWELIPNDRLLDIFKNTLALEKINLTFEQYLIRPDRYVSYIEQEIIGHFSANCPPNINRSLDPRTNINDFFKDIEHNRNKQFFIRMLLNRIDKNILSKQTIYRRITNSLDNDAVTVEKVLIKHFDTKIQTQEFDYTVDKDWAICETITQLNTDVIVHLNMDDLIAEQILKGNIEKK